ncbi:MAG TPA: sulfotransferase [Chromatiaceae bacterium]|jgi:hypothetical protein|nr:sulfotransferase [Chromatiaceae bacterium]HIN81559.1 sulfotransferase [Chromatiales bacterium]HIO15078.1 sulfotransferase [Chromatiales bacterium]
MADPLIILTPMRSFSSVVCAMLGQHPEMYGLPEVNLFIADTVGEYWDMLESRQHGRHGLLRALAQLHDGEQTDASVAAATEWLLERRDWTCKKVFDHILESVEPKIAVDKSPRSVLSMDSLNRAREMYPDANYLHLTRHPRATSTSLLANVSQNAEWGGNVDASRLDPEKIWVRAHQNVLDFTASLPLGQVMRLRGEDLLAEPEVYLPQIAEWLFLDDSSAAIDAMMHPETSDFSCRGPKAAELGNDPDFLDNPVLRPGRAALPELDGELEWAKETGQTFTKETLKIARQIGYG